MPISFLLFVLFSSFIANAARADVYRDALQKRLQFVFRDEQLAKTQLGVEVYSLTKQESLFSLQPNAPLSPASVVKLLTALVSLKRLGPDFTYKTEAYISGTREGSTLKGDLYLKGSGDPSLVTERLFLLANDIVRTGITQITGNIKIDDWTFDQVKFDEARIPTNTDRPYNAPVGGMSFNYNTTTVYFRPGDRVGDPPRIFIEPDTGYVRVRNEAKTSARGTAYGLVASRVVTGAGNTIVVRGKIPLGIAEQRSYFNITDPVVYAGSALRWLLGLRGVRVTGTSIEHERVPANAQKIAELESLPMREIVMLMNKFSNNFIADTLVKTLGREIRGIPGTMEKGLQVVREESTRMGLNNAGFHVVSGSGLTRENRMSANHFIRLLNAAYLDFDVLPELLSSLPIAGKDGTLRSRMKGTAAYGRLRGKTGSIDGVAALAGVVQSRGGELLAFSVVMNDRSKTPGAMRPWQNYFGQALADFNRQTPLSERPQSIPDSLEAPAESEPE
jgi:D-alanyl-D-alanine carboxypeptidase/D-alanyl-D-alanine-endopeptidase (penicillin-binding protein 4)